VLGLKAEDMSGQLDLGAQSGGPERGADGEVAAPSVVAKVAHAERKPVHLDTVALAPDGDDRVAISGIRGEAPPEQLKVCVNELGGFRNQAELVLVGLDIEEKAGWVRAQLDAALSVDPPAAVEWTLARTDHQDADTEEVLGVHIVGGAASDMISEAALAIEMGAVLHDIALTVHPHPTMPEALMEAAAHALGEAIHLVNK